MQITPFDSVERQARSDVIDWIDSGAALCRTQKPATPRKHLVAYFPVIDGDYVLLVDHINAGLWLPTGGHVEPGEHPKAAAVREAREELSIDAEFLHEDAVFLSVTNTVGRTAGHTDVSIWYALRGDRSAELQYDQSEFRAVRWFHKGAIPLDRSDMHVPRFLDKLHRRQQAATAGFR